MILAGLCRRIGTEGEPQPEPGLPAGLALQRQPRKFLARIISRHPSGQALTPL